MREDSKRSSCPTLPSAPGVPTASANAMTLNYTGVARFRFGQVEQAIELLRRATATAPRYVGAWRNLGIVLRHTGRLDEALAAHRRVLELVPDYAEGHNDLGIVLRKMNKAAAAEQAYRRAIDLRPDYADAYYNLGNVLLSEDKVEEAIQSYQRAVGFKSGDPRLYRMLGIALQSRGDFDKAVMNYQRAVDIDSNYAPAYANLASALVEKGEVLTAIRYFGRAIGLDPQAVDAHAGLGVALHDSGDIEGALAEYDVCLTLDPGNTRALAYKAIVLEQLGKHDALRELFDLERFLWRKHLDTPEGFRSIGEFNTALSGYARNHQTIMYERIGKTTRGGAQTGELFTDAEGAAATLLAKLEQVVDSYTRTLPEDMQHPFNARRPQRPYRISGWATVLDSGGYQDSHVHPSGWLSGVYYVQVPERVDLANQHQAGWIEFGSWDPRFGKKASGAQQVRAFQPEEGLLLLFPSYFWHRTLPFQSGEQRISYAFDVLR